MEIHYLTGNEMKIKAANKISKDLNINFVMEKLEVPEIQSLDPKEVASFKALEASKILNKPVLVNDFGFNITSLTNFPGALAKYAEDTITPEGYIRLMEDKKDKAAYWQEVIAFCLPGKEPVTFDALTKGTISTEVREGFRGYGYDKIFIPENDTRTFSEMSEEEQIAFFGNEAYQKLKEYLEKEQI